MYICIYLFQPLRHKDGNRVPDVRDTSSQAHSFEIMYQGQYGNITKTLGRHSKANQRKMGEVR